MSCVLTSGEPFGRVEGIAAYGERGLAERVAVGQLVRLFRGVYVDAATPIDDRLRIIAAKMSVGGDLVPIRESAAALHGFGVLPSEVVHLAGPPERTATAPPGLRLHGLKLSDVELTDIGGLRTTTAERTVVDLARAAGGMDALAVVDAALRMRVCTAGTLASQLDVQRGQRGIVRARDVIARGDGRAESPMESRLRWRILAAGLPSPELQWSIDDGFGRQRYRLDLAWPQWRVAVEYDGAVHLDRERQRYDIARRSWLAHARWTVLWATDADVYLNHRRFLHQLGGVLTSAAA